MLNVENARRLAAAIRSGEYHQTKGQLAECVGQDELRYCVWGVACELSGTGKFVNGACVVDGVRYDSDPPFGVQQWLGLAADETVARYDCRPPETLMALNDRGVPFPALATAIDNLIESSEAASGDVDE